MKQVAALFCRKDSIYKTLPGVDVWDAERDARNWPGGCPVVAHPPCAQWGELSHMANDKPAEKWLTLVAVSWVRMFGGVLEHPKKSKVRAAAKLPAAGARDAWGGWTMTVSQKWWGHRAEKKTLLYVVGCQPKDVPNIPYCMREPEVTITTSRAKKKGREMTKHWEREVTPPRFAEWLVELARRCEPTGGL